MSLILRRAAAVAARLLPSRHGTILCYHGIEPRAPSNPTSAHVSLRQFFDTIDMACAVAEPVTLRELIARHAGGRSTAGLFAVTFDDAYASLASDGVRDLLTGGRVPATIFVVTGASATGARFWWDRVETLHPVVAAEVWSEFERSIGLPDAYRTPAARPFGALRPLRQWVLHQHAGRWPLAAEEALAALENAVNAPPSQRPMTFDEIDLLVHTGPIDIGVHTVTHPVLPLLSDENVREEVRSSHAVLRARWPSTLPWLAAPFGLYDDRTSALAREGGLEGILNLHSRSLVSASALHGLPRTNVMEGAATWKLGLRMGGLGRVIARMRGDDIRFPDSPTPD